MTMRYLRIDDDNQAAALRCAVRLQRETISRDPAYNPATRRLWLSALDTSAARLDDIIREYELDAIIDRQKAAE
jgi:hypothetical protein